MNKYIAVTENQNHSYFFTRVLNPDINKSPKGHWSLTWVQWALLLKVRFLNKWLIRKHDCHICEISPNSKQFRYFRIRGCIQFVAVAFRSEEENFWRRGPSLTYFCAALDPSLGGSGRKAETHVQGHDYFIHSKFGRHPSICSVGKAKVCVPIHIQALDPPPSFT